MMNSAYFRAVRAPRMTVYPRVNTSAVSITQRFAHSSYGNQQSGQPGQENDLPNKQVEKEHPGPPAPDVSSSKKSSSQSSSQSTSSDSSQKNTSTSHDQGGQDGSSSAQSSESGSGKESKDKNGHRPAILDPGPAPEEQSEEVRQHNKEVSERYEKSQNRITGDYKVEKSFWKNNTGN